MSTSDVRFPAAINPQLVFRYSQQLGQDINFCPIKIHTKPTKPSQAKPTKPSQPSQSSQTNQPTVLLSLELQHGGWCWYDFSLSAGHWRCSWPGCWHLSTGVVKFWVVKSGMKSREIFTEWGPTWRITPWTCKRLITMMDVSQPVVRRFPYLGGYTRGTVFKSGGCCFPSTCFWNQILPLDPKTVKHAGF